MKPTLVVLAAGIGSRFGGLKQVEPVGPHGAVILDYSCFDALRSGFGRAVCVIRPEMEDDFRARLGDRISKHLPVEYVFQRGSDLPAGFTLPSGRTKPWGTGHAVLVCAERIREPFAIVNADDYYGARSLALVADFLRESAGRGADRPATYAMVGYPLRETLSDSGTVSRGFCKTTAEGWLEDITEITKIERHGDDGMCKDERGAEQILPGDSPVSMNLWAFAPGFFGDLRAAFLEFMKSNATSMTAEFFLPTVVQELMKTGAARVRVLRTPDAWSGITNREDLPKVQAHIRALIGAGVYPEKLWNA